MYQSSGWVERGQPFVDLFQGLLEEGVLFVGTECSDLHEQITRKIIDVAAEPVSVCDSARGGGPRRRGWW